MVSTSFFLLERFARFLYCDFIIAPIQLFVKGFSKLFFVGGVESEACARLSSLSNSQELRFCHPLDNYYITTDPPKCQ